MKRHAIRECMVCVKGVALRATMVGMWVTAGGAAGQCPIFFHQPDRLAVGNEPQAIAAADLNRDGATDVVVLEGYPGPKRLRTYLGRGDGTFAGAGSFTPTTSSTIGKIMLAEVSGDGIADAVLMHRSNGTFEVRPGRGDGTFRDRGDDGRFDAGRWRFDATLADVDGDGRLDLVGVDYFEGQVTVLLNAGGGNFGPAVRTTVGGNPISVAGGDLDGDGRADLVVEGGAGAPGALTVLRSLGDGMFSPLPPLTVVGGCGRAFPVIMDLNSDGRRDVLVLTCSEFASYLGTPGGLAAGPVSSGQSTASDGSQLAFADVNGDGKVDAVLGGFEPNVMAGLGTGAFGPAQALPALFPDGSGNAVTAVFAADVNGDGRPDVGAVHAGSALAPGTLSVELNRGRQPTIIGVPVMPPVVEGASVVLTVIATGPIRTYQWLRDGAPLSDGGRYHGTRSATLQVAGLTEADAAAGFACRVNTDCGTVTSGAATVEVTPSCPSDYNGDGFVDFFDYDAFVAEFEVGC